MIFQGDSNILLWPRSPFRWQSKGSGFSRRANFPKSGDDWISQSCCSRVCSGFYRVSVVTFGLVRMGQRVWGRYGHIFPNFQRQKVYGTYLWTVHLCIYRYSIPLERCFSFEFLSIFQMGLWHEVSRVIKKEKKDLLSSIIFLLLDIRGPWMNEQANL